MDLLGNYESSSGSEDEGEKNSDSNDKKLTVPKEKKIIEPSKLIEIEETTQPSSRDLKRKKKLVSLNAVLPSYIFDELARTTSSAINNDESDEEEEDEENDSKDRRKRMRNSATNNKEGMQLLLHDLNALKRKNTNTFKTDDLVLKNNSESNESKPIPIVEGHLAEIEHESSSEDQNRVELKPIEPKPIERKRPLSTLSAVPRPSSKLYANTNTTIIQYPRYYTTQQTQIQNNTEEHKPPPTTINQHQHQHETEILLSRKEIQKSLRSGIIPASFRTIQLEQPKHVSYNTNSEDSMLPQLSNLTTPDPIDVIKTKTKLTPHEISHKRKNQIHHLLKKADKDMQTGQNKAVVNRTSARDGAKRKYGW